MSVYSHSRINSFENCPLKYRYRYIDQIKRDVQSIEAFMGKLVHEVLELLYSDLHRARSSRAGDYVAIFEQLWARNYTPAVKIVRDGLTPEYYRQQGIRCVAGYFDRYSPFRSGEVIGCEDKVEFPLDGENRFQMRGYIDRIDRVADGVIEIHDYKSGALPRRDSLKRDRQLTLYEIGLRHRWPDLREVRHVWHYLAHDREFVERRTADDLSRTRLSTIRAIRTIESTTRFPARTSPLCSWCEYRDICPEWAMERTEMSPPVMLSEPPPPPAIEPRTGQYLLFGGDTVR